MPKQLRLAAALGVLALSAAGCKDFLSGGELTNDPNRPTIATNKQRFVGVQGNIQALLSSDPARLAGLYTQQFSGENGQYTNIYTYGISEGTTGGFYAGLYGSGGLVDVRRLEADALAQKDFKFLGIAEVQEAILVGTGADLFGDIVYSQALKGTPNPALDPQLAVYDSVQAKLSDAIVNLQSTAATNVGPGASDLSYLGNAAKYIKLAHTLKARFYLHTAEVRPAAYAQALAEAKLGILSPADNYVAMFSGNANEQNYFSQFTQVQRSGYFVPNTQFVQLLQSRNDPRLATYFNASQTDLSATLADPGYDQPLVTVNENLLIAAEAAYRTGDPVSALNFLRQEETIAGVPLTAATVVGPALLREILTEKYISLFESIEIYNDYKRNCFPNVAPTIAGGKIPGRLLYDTSERNTNTSIPAASAQPTRNANDPRNTTDPFGNACLAS